jgi:hypothetical protein
VPRFFFDIRLRSGVVEQDTSGVMTPDAATALHECIDAVEDFDQDDDVDSIIVKTAAGDTLMSLNVRALRADQSGLVAENGSQ